MFKIKLVQKPSVINIDVKYRDAIKKVIDWCLEIHHAFECQIYSVYVRGSVVHNFQTVYSDIDMVVLLEGASTSTVMQFENTIDSLLFLYLYPFVVDVKVYTVDSEGYVEPATAVLGSLRKEIKRHINFDLYANGCCMWGERVHDYSKVFETPLAFIENNIAIMGDGILHLRDLMLNDLDFIAYYPLIKKVIKLLAIAHFKKEIGYISTVKACFEYAIYHVSSIKNELILLFNFLEKDIKNMSVDECDTLKRAIIAIVDVILPNQEGRTLKTQRPRSIN